MALYTTGASPRMPSSSSAYCVYNSARNVSRWHLGMWLSQHGGDGLMAGLDDRINVFSNPNASIFL